MTVAMAKNASARMEGWLAGSQIDSSYGAVVVATNDKGKEYTKEVINSANKLWFSLKLQ